MLPAAPGSGVAITIDQGRVSAIGAPPLSHAESLDATLLPGLVDLQVNGAGGRDVAEANADALDAVADAVWRGGAVAFLPTLITAPWSQLLEQITAVVAWMESWRGQGAEPLGLHLEGPFLEVEGAHDPNVFVDPTAERIDALLAATRGRLALVTLAPSRAGAPAAVAHLRRHGVAVALGHGRDTPQFEACVAAGAGLLTHLFNAMGPIHHREPGLAGRALDCAALSCSLICDGVHVDPVMVRNAFRILGVDRTVLVSDAVAAAGQPDGSYRLGGDAVFAKDGVVRRADGTLAGSALTMSLAVQRFARFLGGSVGPWTLARIASSNPARLLTRPDFGSLSVGGRAAFTALHADGSCTAWRAR